MLNIEIRRPEYSDIDYLHRFFKIVITDTFLKEQIEANADDLEQEINTKKSYLEADLQSGGIERYFLIAINGQRIIGTIEYGPPSQLIINGTDKTFRYQYEVGTVFVDPAYQQKGIGNLMMQEMFLLLLNKGITEVCLDSGFRQSQNIWKRKFGTPLYCLKNYWGEGNHHMIWRLNVNDVLKKFK
ncbi:GNAT family N-acetyltransferase [Rossellomorea aquimaris]|uniref:GNAT family N-acetyltransferase n=1 Tax=Rossellomorea aquimaris TaxID=189382 RepID=A0A1J6W318_9BACI|nr:GNAT family N-acetyltransferase [Rossellomorea aquimaris]OIU71997.1 GNAT family N-acetyltransferase [Rossellomorea aquimaris]